MKIVGLTGGIGSGKSTVLALFKNLGAAVYIADDEAKKLMNSDKELISFIKKIAGDKAYSNQVLNKAYLAELIFNNKEILVAINAVVHPKVRDNFQKFIKESKAPIVIYEAAILFESGSSNFCDYVITVIANYKAKIERIAKRDFLSIAQIEQRMQHQTEDDFKIKHSNFVIQNNCLDQTKIQVETIYKMLIKT
ncbi:dephospho-CoA kinase [Lutibacter sp.]|uniref:dephospho-CoA kinase n=1 Tax=Lutibacter sp. TaxID=1925666 RepID=UPI002737075E|nr:dephospho-CoA kinase [Lutibacter sp.]MDP3313529.1 dephospho-CoA kinase [Lutibacter sp.]